MCLQGQTVSGSLSGTVVDPSGNVVPAVGVKLSSERTGEERSATTNETGDFVFPALQPGTDTVTVEVAGFRPLKKTGNVLSAAERLSVGNLALTVGSVTESITIAAQAVTVQTSSTEHSALIGARQLEQISIRGRDVVSMLRILPGVSQTVDTEFLGGSFGTQSPNIQGTRSNWNSLQVDGVTGNDLGSPGTFSSPINMDAIGEVKVLMNNYQAEYGRNGGSSINVLTKSGSREYHGTAYWFKRHESWNANNFFNNRTGVPLPIYRYSTLGATVGGPVNLGKLMPGSKDKVFFFYSFEKSWVKNPQAVRQVTVPSALERTGDYSQTVDVNNRPILIRDPLSNSRWSYLLNDETAEDGLELELEGERQSGAGVCESRPGGDEAAEEVVAEVVEDEAAGVGLDGSEEDAGGGEVEGVEPAMAHCELLREAFEVPHLPTVRLKKVRGNRAR